MSTPMKPAEARKAPPQRLYWIKYNPHEWQGMYNELNDEEYGLFHRIIAKLWALPDNRATYGELLIELRAKPESRRGKLIRGLIGYALKQGDDGRPKSPDRDPDQRVQIKTNSRGSILSIFHFAHR